MSGLQRYIAPELVGRLKSVLRRGNHYTGDYADWNAARAASTGYDAGAILQRVRDAVRKVRDGEAVCERDSVLFDEPQLSFPVLAGLLRAAVAGGRLSVLDFGGSLGSSYFQSRAFLDAVKPLVWTVVEQEGFVRCGRDEFQTPTLRFDFDIAEAVAAASPNVALLSGVLQYLPDPYAILRELAHARLPVIVIDRLVSSDRPTDRIAVQHVPPSIYEASYPIRIFGRGRVEESLADRYQVLARFDTVWDGSHVEYCGDLEFRSRGLILERRP